MRYMRELIVAYGLAREIGRDGDMPWGRELPADLRRFRDLTIGRAVIMGYNTFVSIGRPLPNRQNIVVTSRDIDADVTAARSLEQAYDLALHQPIVIGGAQLYTAALPGIDVVHATEVQAEFPGSDTFFPELPDDFVATARELRPRDDRNRYDLEFVTYAR